MIEAWAIGIIGACIGILQALIIFILMGQNRKINKICEENSKAHNDLWKRIYGHFHTEKGDVVVPHEAAG
jgi:hypothetical protein